MVAGIKQNTGLAGGVGRVVMVGICVLGPGCSSPDRVDATTRDKDAPMVVAAARVTRHDLARDVELAAEFRAYQDTDLYAKVSGYLKTIHVDVGDHVKRGQLIALLEVPEMAQDLAHATATFKRSQLEVERARGDLRRAEAGHHIRKLSYDRLAAVSKARPTLIAQQEIDDALSRLTEAEAQLAASRAALAVTQEQVSVATAAKDRIDTMLSYLRITAPFSGVITKRNGDPGAMIQAGTASHTQAMPVVRLSQIDRLRLILPVPEAIAGRIRVGAPVEIRVDSLQRVFQGKVSRFPGNLDTATRTMATEVDIPNPKQVIMPGMYGYASLKLDSRVSALAVPVQAVTREEQHGTVMVINGQNTLERRRVSLGLETPSMLEVRDGLSNNELVVIGNTSRLRAGARVEPKLIEMAAGGDTH